jgi:hypothetical protein
MTAPTELTTAQRDLRAPRAAGVAGIAFSVLLSVGLVLIRSQGVTVGMTDAQLADWFATGSHNAGIAGLYCIPFAGIAFLWFMAVVRDRIGVREDRFLSTVFFGSGLLFVGCVFISAATAGSIVLGVPGRPDRLPTPEMVELAAGQAYTILFVFGIKLGAVFLISTATIARRLALFGRWLPRLGYAFAAVLLLAVGLTDWVILLFPLWVALLSIEILRRQEAADQTLTPISA